MLSQIGAALREAGSFALESVREARAVCVLRLDHRGPVQSWIEVVRCCREGAQPWRAANSHERRGACSVE